MPSERLKRLRRNLDNIPWGEIGQDGIESIFRNFDVGGRPRRWPARKKSRPWPILNKSGNLKASHYSYPVSDGVILANREKKYARTHHHGDRSRNIKKRKFLIIPPIDVRGIKRKIKKHMVSGTK